VRAFGSASLIIGIEYTGFNSDAISSAVVSNCLSHELVIATKTYNRTTMFVREALKGVQKELSNLALYLKETNLRETSGVINKKKCVAFAFKTRNRIRSLGVNSN